MFSFTDDESNSPQKEHAIEVNIWPGTRLQGMYALCIYPSLEARAFVATTNFCKDVTPAGMAEQLVVVLLKRFSRSSPAHHAVLIRLRSFLIELELFKGSKIQTRATGCPNTWQ